MSQTSGEADRVASIAEASGNTEGAAGLRRLARIEEQEREALTSLIDRLQRRFPAPGPPRLPLPRAGRGSWFASTAWAKHPVQH